MATEDKKLEEVGFIELQTNANEQWLVHLLSGERHRLVLSSQPWTLHFDSGDVFVASSTEILWACDPFKTVYVQGQRHYAGSAQLRGDLGPCSVPVLLPLPRLARDNYGHQAGLRWAPPQEPHENLREQTV
eukprot:11211091-Lingulodinium_polyedra.AAC.1